MSQRIVDPVLNIFVGTSPAAVAHAVNRQLLALPETDRRRVGTLMIDTMRLQVDGWKGVRPYGSDLMQIQTPKHEGYSAWETEQRKNMYVSTSRQVQHKPGIGTAGAGGIRNNAHLAMCMKATDIQQRILDKYSQIGAPPLDTQTERISDALRVNIITFLGGGTGSGILPALSVLTRYLASRRANMPQTAIYAILPEQPRGLTEEMRRRQRSNTFASLLELMTLLRLKDAPHSANYVIGPLTLDVSALQVVDLVYLYGHGKLTDHEDIYQHIAMDLLLRMQDGHGAGAERKRQLPDISALKDKDGRQLPTCFATSGVTEIVFPREELIGAWSRLAARTIVATQMDDPSDWSMEDRCGDQLHQTLLHLLDTQIQSLVTQHRPDSFEIDIYEAGDSWYEQLEERREAYRKHLNFERSSVLRALEQEWQTRIDQYISGHHQATFARYARIYEQLAHLMRTHLNRLGTSGESERDFEFEQQAFSGGLFRRFRPLDGAFLQYANDQLSDSLDTVNNELRRGILGDVCLKLDQERDLRLLSRRQESTLLSDISQEDRTLLETARLPYGHRYYAHLALPTPHLLERCYTAILTAAKLREDGRFNIKRVFEALQEWHKVREHETWSRNGRHPEEDAHRPVSGDIRRDLEGFFAEKVFRPGLSVRESSGIDRPKTVLEIILDVDDKQLLRQHISWGLEWTRGHLEYHRHQEPTTNGRVVRQLDVGLAYGDYRQHVLDVLQQEMTRSEVQDGLKLLDAVDPDRISFLYTEYGVPVRSIEGMHEPNNSYLSDYVLSQEQWMDNGTMPPHTSDKMMEQVAQPVQAGQPLVSLMADVPTQFDTSRLYSKQKP